MAVDGAQVDANPVQPVLDHRDTKLRRQRLDRILTGTGPGAAEFDYTTGQFDTVDPPADPVAGLQNSHGTARTRYCPGGHETGDAATCDNHIDRIQDFSPCSRQITGNQSSRLASPVTSPMPGNRAAS